MSKTIKTMRSRPTIESDSTGSARSTQTNLDSQLPAEDRSFIATSRRAIKRAPQLTSLAILLGCWLLTQALSMKISDWFGVDFSRDEILLVQTGVTIAFSLLASLPVWWLLINAIFPLAVNYALELNLPPTTFMYGLLLLTSIYWSVFLTRVPYYPSSDRAREAVELYLTASNGGHFLDIGSGTGGVCLRLCKGKSNYTITGIEIAPMPWLISWLRGQWVGAHCVFIRGSYHKHSLKKYSAIFAYLSPAAMEDLWEKASAEMMPGAILISCEFNAPGLPASGSLKNNSGASALYIWEMDSDRNLLSREL